MSNNFKWAMIGHGNVTLKKSRPAYQKTNGFKMTAVVGRNAERVKKYASENNILRFSTQIADILNDKNVDAVYIATPPDTHKQYALMVAEAGKICCIEKPMAIHYSDCLEVCEAFEAKNIPLFVAYYRRSLPRFNIVKQWIDDGEIGEIRHVRWHLSKAPNQLDLNGAFNWRTDRTIALGGYFDDIGSHGIDLIIYLLGEIKDASGICTNQLALYSAFDSISASWIHKSGVTGSGSWNFGSKQREDMVEIYGSKGKITFSVFDEHGIKLENGDSVREEIVKNPENIQLYHVQNMRESLQHNIPHPSTGRTAAHTTWVMDKILGNLLKAKSGM